MFLKRAYVILAGLLCFVCTSASAYIVPLSPQSFEQLYAYAASGKVDIITNAVSRGMYIDSVNANGDTGLCVAAKRGNRRAYKSFLMAGANPSHECTWNIKGYREFMQSVISNPVKNLDTAAVAKYGATGMSWTTKALIGAGVVAAGTGTALAFSGGGGGGSSSDPNCIHGYRNDQDVCICHTGYDGPKCNDCATGYGHYGTSNCYQDIPDCGHGAQLGGGCKCDTGWSGPSCHACASGYGFNSAGDCVVQSADMLGNTVNRNYNASGDISLNSTTFQNVYGLFYDAEDTYAQRAPYLDQSTFVNTHKYLRDADATSTVGTETKYHNIGSSAKSITINKTGSGHVYGMYSSAAENIYNDYLYLESGIVQGVLNSSISITSKGDGNVYGMYGNGNLYGAYLDGIAGYYYGSEEPPTIVYSDLKMNSTIIASNIGSGAVYGMYNGSATGTVYNENDKQTYTDPNDITHTLAQTTSSVTAANLGDGDAYGLYSKGGIINSGALTVTANAGDAYGMTAAADILHTSVANVTSTDGKAYGMYGIGDGIFANAAYLTVQSTNSDVYGAHLQQGGSFANGGQITVSTTTGNAYGVLAKNVAMTNSWGTSSGALIVSTTSGDAYGVLATGNSTINNTASILVSTGNGNAYGIYNVGGSVTNSATFPNMSVYVNNTGSSGIACGIYSDGGTVNNTGRIDVYGSPGTTTYGIWATNNAVVTLTDTFLISINDSTLDDSNYNAQCNAASGCTTPLGDRAIYLTNGATLINASHLMSLTSLNLGKKGVTLAPTGSISAGGKLSGGLSISSTAVTAGFNDTYTLTDAINATDTSELHLTSESALFNAALNGHDVVLTKKAFSDMTDNASFADFLEKNYATHHNAALFETLKSQTDLHALSSALKDLTGESLKTFALEDRTLLKELDFDIQQSLQNNTQSLFTLTGNNATVPGKKMPSNERYQWFLSGKKEGKKTFGIGAAYTSLKNNHDTKRRDEMFLTMMPVGYQTHGLDLLSTLRLGYAYGTYTRKGFANKDYTGHMEKRILGLTNSASYPVKFASWTLAPTAEFNALAYRLKGHEDAQRFALNIEKQNVTSLEAGVGLRLNYTSDLAPNKKLNFATQLMLYHEFLDPYRLKLGMQDMTGTFELKDEKRRLEHMVLKNSFEYRFDALSVYADLFSYIDTEYTTKADIGLKWAF